MKLNNCIHYIYLTSILFRSFSIMGKNISILTLSFFLLSVSYAQQLEYDVQSCFNLNETVQDALYETLLSDGELEDLNTMLDFPITAADVANLRPFSSGYAFDVELCNYVQSNYEETTWNNIGHLYYIYHYMANDFYFDVFIMIPKSMGDPDFSTLSSSFSIVSTIGFTSETGFQDVRIITDLINYPDLILPVSGD